MDVTSHHIHKFWPYWRGRDYIRYVLQAVGILGAVIDFHFPYLPWGTLLGSFLKNRMRSEHLMMLDIYCQVFFFLNWLYQFANNRWVEAYQHTWLISWYCYLFLEVDSSVHLAKVLKLRIILWICESLHLESSEGGISYPLRPLW